MATDVSAVSLPARLPQFWRKNPRLWFAQFEAAIAATKASDENKFNLVIPLLGYDELEVIADIVLDPPETEKYSALKTRLIGTFQESENSRMTKLSNGIELGDRKPSQLLRVIRDTSRGLFTEEAVRISWMNQLPPQIKAVLAADDNRSLDALAETADRIMECCETPAIAAVAVAHGSADSCQNCRELAKSVDTLQEQVAALDMKSKNQPCTRCQNTSPLRSRKKLCFYHKRFGVKATRCRSPCEFRRQTENYQPRR